MSWSVRPSEINPLLDDTPGNEVDGKERGKENCAAGIFGNSSEENVQFAHVQDMFFCCHFVLLPLFFSLFVCSVNWSFKTLAGR